MSAIAIDSGENFIAGIIENTCVFLFFFSKQYSKLRLGCIDFLNHLYFISLENKQKFNKFRFNGKEYFSSRLLFERGLKNFNDFRYNLTGIWTSRSPAVRHPVTTSGSKQFGTQKKRCRASHGVRDTEN